MSTEQRHALRHTYPCQIIVATKNNSCITLLENLSPFGCCIQKTTDWNFSPNDVLNLYFIVEDGHIIDAEAMLIWEDASKVGLQYLKAQAVPIQIIDEVQ